MLILEYTYKWIAVSKKIKQPWWCLLGFAKSQFGVEGEKKDILNLYWYNRAMLLREEGKLPAWEGILLVREKE